MLYIILSKTDDFEERHPCLKTANALAVIGEYAGFKIAVSFDAFNHKFVMNLKGQLSHNLEVGSDPLGNISRINHALGSMPRQLM